MAVTLGTRLGVYEITAAIGAGGMGEVYQARDTRLKRDVALKFLPESVSRDPERLQRFQREAEISASLNHPNIAAIHGLEESDGLLALVLELVDGPTLADRIAQGPMPQDEALPIAKQIADALEAAHERGIVHRDLKPANIKVRPDGTVKVLDFGLAKLLEPDLAAAGVNTMSPTITSPAMTGLGVILGTAAYMSPEQARGKAVDKRTDIWAFGCVLYEMLSGRRAFDAEEVGDTLAAILTANVDLSKLPAETPARLLNVVSACLQRDPRQRIRDAGDLRLLIAGAFESAAPQAIQSARASSNRIWQRPPIAAALAIALVGGWVLAGWTLWTSRRPESRRPARLTIPLQPDEDLDVAPFVPPQLALSPDGQVLVYAARRAGVAQLYRRQLDQLSATPIQGSEGATVPFFSPDGAWIGFSTGETIKKVPAAGGDSLLVTRASVAAATWAPNDTIFIGGSSFGSLLLQVPAAGGDAKAITTLNVARGDLSHGSPELLPRASVVLFEVNSASTGRKIIAQSLSTGQQKEVIDGVAPRYVRTGHVVFLRGTSLWAVPFDANRLEVTGSAVRLVEGVLGPPAIGREGTLMYLSGVPPRIRLVWVDRRGGEEALPIEPAGFRDLAVSPDGQRIAVAEVLTGDSDVWIGDLVRHTLTRLTTDPGVNAWPLWTPDGQSLVYSSTRESHGGRDLFRRAADGTGPVERLTNSVNQQSPWAWSRDGKTIVVQEFRPGTPGFHISTVSREGGNASILIKATGSQLAAAVSPDGRWIAYGSAESGRSEVLVRPFPNVNDGRWQISTDGGNEPKWAPNGRELFYRRLASVMRVSIDTDPVFKPGKPERLFDGDYERSGGNKAWDVAPDGRFLMKKALRAEYSVNVVLNWTEELKQRVPTR